MHVGGQVASGPCARRARIGLEGASGQKPVERNEAALGVGGRLLGSDFLKAQNIGTKVMQYGLQSCDAALELLVARGRPIKVFKIESRDTNIGGHQDSSFARRTEPSAKYIAQPH